MTDLDPLVTAAEARSRPEEALRVARETLLTAGAVLGVVSLLAGLLCVAVGLRPMVFRSGSMAPAIDTGALALARMTDAQDLARGDIVSVITSTGSRVTHRITQVSIDPAGVATLELKGDANETADQEVYQVSSADRVFFAVPFLGYVVGSLTGPAGIFLLGLYAAFLLSVLITGGNGTGGRPPAAPPGPPRRRAARAAHPPRALRRRRLTILSATLAVSVGVTFVSAPAWAAWTDPAPVNGIVLVTATPIAPVVVCGPLQLGSVTINWTPVPGATGYRLSFGSGGSSTEDVAAGVTSKTFTGTSGTFSVRALFGPTWISANSNAKNYSSLLGLLGTCT